MSTDADAPASEHPSRRPLRPDVLRARLGSPAGPVDRLEVVPRAGSTNTDLAAAVRDDEGWAGVGLLVTEHQVDGRGRSGREWQTPPAAALTFSLAVRPTAPPAEWGWLPLLVGLATVRAVGTTAGVDAVLKWPNDVVVEQAQTPVLPGWGTARKVGGILVELVSTARGPVAVVGVGLNVSQTPAELPVPWAQSLVGAGGTGVDREELLVALVQGVDELLRRWHAAGDDVVAAGLAQEVLAACSTLGRRVRVHLPGGEEVDGLATGLERDGALLVQDDAGALRPVRAGDVEHVRAPAGGFGVTPPRG
jgi:BirA family biotin operon repressor/biotin-[acetyl-CoA-carboxylase] ligase